ncbi:MAG: amidohydrolase [Candidatus Baltobacteraceae bacterium]
MIASEPVPTEDLIRVRRFLHEHPELSMLEYETAAFVAAELRALELDAVRTGVGRTGVMGTLVGGRPGPVTLLRADLDALPILELGESTYRSKRDGVMHACGHDGHVAILLAAARTLAERRAEVSGTLVFCFQPGEEGSAGNRLMIEDGALENPHVDRTFALHLYTSLDVGKIGVRDGPFFASSDRFRLAVRGKGGHGAMPDGAIDPVVAAAYLVTMLQTIVSREVAPKEPAVVTVGKFAAGTTFNVIPDEAELLGTVRTFDAQLRARVPERMQTMIESLGVAFRVECDFEYLWSYPATVNDRGANDVVRRVGRATLGDEAVIDPHDVVMWGEDMSFMQEVRPGAYFIVGARGGPGSAFPHHNARFDVDERALEVGYRMMLGLGLAG